MSAYDLKNGWLRSDLRRNFLAPGIWVFQALTSNGKTASGADLDPDLALLRCLGEAAEVAALAARPDLGFAAARDGVAAHPDPDRALRTAVLEAWERFTAWRWWLRAQPCRQISDDWLTDAGLVRDLASGRAGAAWSRRTGFWCLSAEAGPAVIACRSTDPDGRDPILGYGCDPDPVAATRKALREMFLMEMNLVELDAARSSGNAKALIPVRERIAGFQRRQELFPQDAPIAPAALPSALDLDRLPDLFGADVACLDITPQGGPLAVWLCQPDLPPPDLTGPQGSPFL